MHRCAAIEIFTAAPLMLANDGTYGASNACVQTASAVLPNCLTDMTLTDGCCSEACWTALRDPGVSLVGWVRIYMGWIKVLTMLPDLNWYQRAA